ncbi:hemagglutinin repeat-containing protein [Burkholderia multivorans]|uniref:hemagglutinin repeat-containing protein n=2 Tax=Burkholderia multivorans TaxID=87883 RepID=UPI0006A6448D|nr:hemagglutinin repeat-containing protein [Burkholderia multivorans]KOE26062.1 cell surface protein [Burkholderia multivorans R-20526]MBU9247355.1 hemagglutinin repeat-containing protein [Burkholderia multivorans]MCO7335895.1 hemagglutinin repeat-containing protein [Burkholderia multivorans]MCO7339959.1 hemagglutinin repeat-containing protein [Burkholderia multivorans]MCO7345144.1 hemagglutinin repeat-containing protein [Burkholderia multivorans]
MNKNQYRLVYSRVRGMLVAVEETAGRTGKTNTGETRRAAKRGGGHPAAAFALRVAAFGALVAAGANPIWANAQIVGAGPQAPAVVQTPNGLPQVNINKPSAAGVSLNTYSQFDVQKNGAILNNASTIVNTQQAGYINGNPNLSAGQAARIIVNQVNSTAASQIKGYVEIAGSRAEVVLANPAGIVVDGGGFINTSRAVLTTGVPQFGADGSLTGFNVNRGLVTVQGAGLDASTVDQTDIIARAVQANAAIYAKNLNVIAGTNQVNHDTLAATQIAGDGPAPAVAIDVAQLGGMYANRVFLVGNSAGVGVANAGTIAAQAGDLTLQSDGRLVLAGKTTASGNLAMSASGGIQNSGTTYAQQSLSANTAADLTNSGTLAAQQNATVNAGSINSTGTLGAGVNNDGSVAHSGDLNLTASGQLTATGQNVAGGNASLTGGSVNLAGSQIAANGNLSLNATAGDVNLSNATTSAQGAIQANASGTVINDHGSLSSGSSTTLTGGNLSNQGGKVSSQGQLSVNVAGQIANQSGELVSESTVAVRGGAIANNRGTIQSAAGMTIAGASLDNTAGRITSLNSDGLTVTTGGELTNAAGTTANGAQGGVIGGNGDVTVQGGNVANHGRITSNANLQVSGQSVANANGVLQAAQKVAVDAGTRLTNNGGSIAGQTATLTGTTLDNSRGAVQATQLSFNATDLVNHGGTITQTGTAAMSANVSGTLDNSNGGTLQSNSTDLLLGAAAIVNDGGTITHAGNGTLTIDNGTGRVSNVGGTVISNGRVAARTGTLNNAAGVISSQTGLAATVGSTLDNTGGKLLSNADLDIAGGTLKNDGGRISANTNASIENRSMTNSGGSIAASTLSMSASELLDNSRGTLEANQLALTAPNLRNHNGTITQYGASATNVDVSDTIDNSAGGVIQTRSTDLTLSPATLINDGGTITHVGTGTLTLGNGANAISNAGGKIVGNGRIDARSATFDNTAGSITAQNGLTAEVSGTLNNASGKLLSSTDLGVTAGMLVNDAGQIGASANATIQAATMTNKQGSIVAPNLVVDASNLLDNSQGRLEANQLALTAANLTNHSGSITQYGTSAMAVDVSGTLDNSSAGVIQTNSTDLTLKPGALNNAGGTITHAGTGTLTIAPGNGANALNNASGTIVTKGQAVVSAGSWNNANGILAAQHGVNATIGGDVNNTQGLLRSTASLSLTAGGAISNRGGHMQAGQSTAGDTSTLDLRSASLDNADGAIVDLGAGRMNVQGGAWIANSHAGNVSGMGAITGNGDVTIGAASISNTQGGQLSGGSLHVNANAIDNSGGAIGNVANTSGDVDVATGGAITNTNGRVSSTRNLTMSAATLLGGGAYSATRDVNVNLQGDYVSTSDTQFNVGHDLTFTLPGTFTNYANLQSVNNLSVNAGNVVNVGALTAGGLLRTQSANLFNTGALVGASTSLNATDTVSNVGPTALIGASDTNGTLEILARDIENRDDTSSADTMATTAIFGMGKVVLAGGKDAGGNYTNAAVVNNASALVQSGGDMELHADRVTNTRRQMQTSGATTSIDPAVLEQLGISMSGCVAIHMEACSGQDVGGVRLTPDPAHPDYDPAPIIAQLQAQPGGVYTIPPGGGQWNSSYQYTTYTGTAVANTITALSAAGQIVSGGSINATTVGNLQNYWSHITAVGNVDMPQHYDGDGWAASGQQAPAVTVTYSGYYHYNNYDNTEHNWTLPFGDMPFVGGRPGGYTQAAPADVKKYAIAGYDSTLGSNGTISGTGVSINNTAGNASIPSLGLLPGQEVPGLTFGSLSGNAAVSKTSGGMVTGQVSGAGAKGASVTGKPVQPVSPIIASATAQNVLNNLAIPQGGLYRPNPSPNASYVIETNPAFTNQKTFLSSDYFFNQIGVDLTHIPKRLGDGFYEQQLVRNEVTALTGKAVLGPYTDLQTMYQSLMAAGADLAKSLDLPVGASLSADQVSKLTGNVIMMETRVVDGQSVLVPVVYLAQANQQNVNGPLITATDIDLKDAQNFTNSGTVKADNTLSIQGKQIDNAFGALQSGGLMSLTTDGQVDLTSAKVKAGSLNLDAGGDLVLNTATNTSTQVSRDGATSVKTTLGPVAQLDVVGDASIKTGGNFQQNAGSLTVGGNLGMNVGGNWDLGAVQTGEHKIVQRANGVSNTDLNSVVGSSVKVGGQSNVVVGGDLTAKGAQIDLGQGGTIAAKGNVMLGTASSTSTVNANSSGDDGSRSYAETLHSSSQTLAGTTLTAGNSINIVSGKDITLSGSAISLEKGNANLLAVGDVNVGAATEAREYNSHETHSHSNVVSGSKVASGIDQTASYSVGSSISADGVTVKSGRDINVTGSNIVGTNDVLLSAARDVNIKTSQDTVQSSTYYEKKESGLLSNGGMSVTVGSRSMTDRQQSATVTNNASSIGSLDGNLSIAAGNNVNGTAAILHAGNDVDITGKGVRLDSAYDTMSQAEQQQYRQAGVTVGLSSPVIALAQTGKQMIEAAGKTKGDARLTALAAVTTGLAAKNTYDATGGGDPATTAKSVGINISLGASKSDNQSQALASTAVGSTVSAGRNVSITATGAGANSDIDVIGSTISAGNDTKLKADGKVNLQAAESTSSLHSTNSGGSFGVGVSIGFGQQNGIAFTAGVAGNRGNANGDSTTWSNTHVTAGNTLTIESGGDTNLKGAVASGKQVIADVGGNLNIESLQNTDHYDSKQQSAGVSVSVCVPPICAGSSSVSGNISQQKMHSDYAAVAEQSGIKAGDAGYQVDVKGNTDLKGGVIASSDKSVQDGVNSLTTATLTYSDIQNHASYDASSVGISGGYGGTIGKNQKGTADNVNPVAGTDLPNRGGLSATPPIALSASDDASSTTRSGISGGSIKITDNAKQQQLTGKTADETVASVNRDTSNTGGALAPIFDKDKIQAGFDITSQFINQVGTFVDNRMKEADAARKASKNLDLTPEQRAAAEQKADQLMADWGPGGSYRQVLSALTAAAGGNVTGSTGQFVQAGIVNYLQQQGAAYIGDLVKEGAVTEGSPLHAAMHAIVACAGAAASSQSCGAGAMSAASASLLSNLFADSPNETATEKQAKGNLISSIVAGVAAVGGVSATTATTAAQTEVENNFLTQPQQTARALAKVSCSTAADPSACQQKVQQRYAKLWEDNEAKAKSCASADACKAALTDLRQQQVEYSARENQLQQKLRDTGGLSAAETDELLNLKAADTNLMSLRTSALQSYTRYAGMDALKSLQGSQLIAELGIGAAPGIGAGAAGALTSVGAGALRTIKVVSGGKSNWNAELNNPKPNTVYNVDDSKVYQTDSLARVTRVDGDLSLLTKDRNGYQQVKAGREGDSGDDGGHLIATILNGPGEKLNIVPMDSNLNRGAWKQLENSWADALSAGKQVKVSIEPQYQGDSRRPEGFNITYVVGNGRPAQQYFRNSPGGR